MTRLRDIMTRDVVSVSPDVTIRDAMSLLSTRHISGVPVVAGRDIVGVITSTDLMAFAAELPGAPVERDSDRDAVGEPEVRAPHLEMEPPGEFFRELWEDVGTDVTVRFSNVNGAEWNVLDEHTVEEAMTRAPICSMTADASLQAAAQFMRLHAIHRVLVTEKGKLVGIVTSTDLANAIAGRKLREPTFVFGKESHFTGERGGRPTHQETALGAKLKRGPKGKTKRRVE
jgi:CBS domain-containing protein